MAALARVAIRYPTTVIVASVALAALAMLLTVTRLGYKTSRIDLLNPQNDYNRLWIDYINEFGAEDDAVIVVEGASRDQVVPVLRELATVLAKEDRLFYAVLHGVDLTGIRSKGLHYLSHEELASIERFLAEVGPVVQGGWSRLNLIQIAEGLATRLELESRQPNGKVEERVAEIARLTQSLLGSLSKQEQYRSPWPGMPQSFATLSELSSEYLLMKEGRLGFVLLRLARDKSDSFTRGSEATDSLRNVIAQVRSRHPEVTIGLTGLPVIENDEMRASQQSMVWASVLSLFGVACLFVAGFGGVRHALLANLVLMIGMMWSFGYVVLSVGHLNILSVSFAVTLIGIGIDFGVYYVARYLQHRGERVGCKESLLLASTNVGPAIFAGALTVAVSFFTAAFTTFTGVAELGIIAGGGVLLCAAAQLFVLPAAIYLMDRSGRFERLPEPLPIHRWIAPLTRVPRLVVAVVLAGTVALSFGASRLWYDHNLLNLQPTGLESVELEHKLMAECNQSLWYALSIAETREELLERKARLLELPSVERTEEIVSMLPADHEVKQPIIARIQASLSQLPERPPTVPCEDPNDLGLSLGRLQEAVARYAVGAECARNLEQVRDILRRLPLSECYQLVSHFQQQMAGDLLSRLYTLKSMANPDPPALTDLPASLVHRFVGQHGKHLLKIYGRGNIWDMASLERFVKDVRSVDPRVTGNPLQAYEASLEMKSSYEQAAIYALVVNLLVLWFDFRSIRYALLATVPLALSLVQLFGVMGFMGLPLNPANMIALPLMMGLGVDYGVHIVHEYREHRGRYRLSQAAAVAVTVDALTTIVGFGALMIASHKGLQSLGRVLTLGVTCCMISSLVFLPALLAWMSWNRKDDTEADDADGDAAASTLLPSSRWQRLIWRRREQAHPGTGPHALPPVVRRDRTASGRE